MEKTHVLVERQVRTGDFEFVRLAVEAHVRPDPGRDLKENVREIQQTLLEEVNAQAALVASQAQLEQKGKKG